MGKTGQKIRSRMRPDEPRQLMWNAMRQLRTFSISEIVATSETKYDTARRYVKSLEVCGYLRVTHEGRKGGTDYKTWFLVSNTGPSAPRIGADGLLHDPNTMFDLRADKARLVKHGRELLRLLSAIVIADDDRQPTKPAILEAREFLCTTWGQR